MSVEDVVKKRELASLMESMTVAELKGLVAVKGKLEELTRRRKELEKSLAEVEKRIQDLLESKKGLAAKVGRSSRAPLKPRTGLRRRRKRISQPSLASLVREVLKENKKPMKVSELAATVLEQKKYKTRAKNFKGQLRIILYKNEKGLFKKVGPGSFTVATGSNKSER